MNGKYLSRERLESKAYSEFIKGYRQPSKEARLEANKLSGEEVYGQTQKKNRKGRERDLEESVEGTEDCIIGNKDISDLVLESLADYFEIQEHDDVCDRQTGFSSDRRSIS